METPADQHLAPSRCGHALLDARRLATHREIARRVDADPSLLGHALGNIERWTRQMGRTPPALAEWQRLLRTPWQRIRPHLVEDDEESRRLRQSSPFAGILTQRERTEIRRAAR